MKRLLISSLVFASLILATAFGQEKKDAAPSDGASEGPQIGQPAPDFELPWADQAAVHVAKGEWVKLSSLKGSNVILAFYVADWTGG
jgi:hypothetical protein